MFENSEYQELIDKINRVRSYGLNTILTIPQIAIVGDQSSGKSSVLEAITRLAFPRNMETCTRFATQVSMRMGERNEISARIEGEPEFNERYAHGSSWDIQPIISDANNILCPVGSGKDISERVLEITISGPEISPLTIIDLPGYINTVIDGQDKSMVSTIRAINTRYIQDNRTIILAVVPADNDLNNMFVLDQAERYDPSKERTIPIVTKPDRVEADRLPNLIQTLLNKRKFMSHGYLVMRNSSNSDIGRSWDEARKSEEDFFRSHPLWDQIESSRKGRVSVKTFLGNVLYNHILKELPSLKEDIQRLINERERELSNMGPELTSTEAAKTQYLASIQELQKLLTDYLAGNHSLDYINSHMSNPTQAASSPPQLTSSSSQHSSSSTQQNIITYTIHSRQRDSGVFGAEDDLLPLSPSKNKPFLRSTLHNLYERFGQAMHRDKYNSSKDKIRDLLVRYRGNELPGFVTFTTFMQIYMETTLVHWRNVTKEHISNMHAHLYEAVAAFISFSADPLLKDLLLIEFEKFYSLQTKNIADTIEDIFTDESIPFAMNRFYYESVLQGKKAKLEQHIQEYAKSTNPKEKNDARNTTIDYNGQLAGDIAVEELHDQLQAYCEVARKRIVDVVLLQTIERFMVKHINVYFKMLITIDETHIMSRLLDSPAKLTRRQELQDKVAVLRRSLVEL
ncbi:P-loop containing nucleoside triphosphate hydrolase protein [Lobosporangium transversale]|uniref:p-loop containing nucleoside triphosphate hydrolase protein n=1 Tax=Lobosporangium transversale TaxID=64571 RepID=A0A1Y2GZ42_9FUNG|nr:P-loop containing nucleoside triphosphate hydrolase protein [Lobosporangium transversale]ORZ24856.1 P-loop containing nucleoside triphosphate hydrolase protein [Lobosporangium transversale]|eukprot:XP_021883837.1 P-loop containing nucleoside triphosphate hydrolase protein [Lobosporangium transversale]